MDFQTTVAFYLEGERQGPGSTEYTKQAISLAQLPQGQTLQVADIGCGTGASTMVLAQEINATVTAVDIFPAFLKVLDEKAKQLGLEDRVKTLSGSMESLPFRKESLDVIWAEGAIYNMGFERGVTQWRPMLKLGGVLAVSEITWLTSKRPQEIQRYWDNQYQEIATAHDKISILSKAGYQLLGYFVLPSSCWMQNYYGPMEKRFDSFLKAHGHSQEAMQLVEENKEEMRMYQMHHQYYGYGFYIARKS